MFDQRMKCNNQVDDICPVDCNECSEYNIPCNGVCSKCLDSTCENHRDYSEYVQLSFVLEV